MYVVPKSEIKIGDVMFYGDNSGVSAVEIDSSVRNLGGTAKITIPRNFTKREGKGILDCIKVGDPVSIRLGYNDTMNQEFTGFVSHIGDNTPLVIECDDEWYTWKKAAHLSKSWKETTLAEVLRFAFAGCTVECPDVNLSGGFIIKNATPYEVVKGLKESYGFYTRLKNGKVRCFFPYEFSGYETHTYVFGTRDADTLQSLQNRNLSPNIADNKLTFTRKEDVKLNITAIAKQRNGKDLKVQIGSTDADAQKRTLTYGNEIISEADLKKKAEQDMQRFSYDGFRGDITGFGVPQTKAGDSLKIVDGENPEREGTYLIESVKITYSISGGFRRKNTLSFKVG